jgi:hypothetical protein
MREVLHVMTGGWRNRRGHILRLVKRGAVCAEVGVSKGDFSQALLKRWPSALHLFEPWL